MQVYRVFCLVMLWWTGACFGAAVDAPTATGFVPETQVSTEAKSATGIIQVDGEHIVNQKQMTKTEISDPIKRDKRSYTFDTLTPANSRYRRLYEGPIKRHPWTEHKEDEEEEENEINQSSTPNLSSFVYFFEHKLDEKGNKKSIETDSQHSAAESSKNEHLEQQPVKRSLSSISRDILNSAGGSIATSFMKRRRGGKMYDVPQVECPRSNDRMERFACPSPDFRGRYRCIDDRSLCDGFFDCPGREDENPEQCLFYKTTKAHLDILAEALLRWARGR